MLGRELSAPFSGARVRFSQDLFGPFLLVSKFTIIEGGFPRVVG